MGFLWRESGEVIDREVIGKIEERQKVIVTSTTYLYSFIGIDIKFWELLDGRLKYILIEVGALLLT